MSNLFGVSFTCAQCNNNINSCTCNMSNQSGTSSVGYSSGTALYGFCPICGNQWGLCTCYQTCPNCGQPQINCICSYRQGINVPYATSTSTSTLSSNKYYCRIFDINSKQRLSSCGQFEEESSTKEHGLLGKLSSFELPLLYENCFFHLRPDDKNIWQIRCPLTFKVELEIEQKPVIKFMSLVNFFTLKHYEDRLVIHDAVFQEVQDKLELTRLVEIQQVFVDLLRRI